jgi:hypothetical protein
MLTQQQLQVLSAAGGASGHTGDAFGDDAAGDKPAAPAAVGSWHSAATGAA